jgi:hypothetical protein
MTKPIRPRTAGFGAFLLGATTAVLTLQLFSPRLQRSRGERTDESTGRGRPAEPPSLPSAVAGYETHDASGTALFVTLAVFAVCIVTAIGMMVALLGMWHRADAKRENGFTEAQRMHTQPPEPRLQVNPFDDLAEAHDSEFSAIHGYAKLNATTARIPIDRAKALLAGHPLDTPAQAAAKPDAPGDPR